jgi:hypothetical protein
VPGITSKGLRATQVIVLPSAAHCVKQLRIRLTHPKSVHLRSLTIQIGHRLSKRKPVPSSVTIRGLAKGHFTVKVSVITTKSIHLSRSRRYLRCA